MEFDGGIDASSVGKLTGKEREKAEEMLIEALRDGGYYAIVGLRVLQSQKAIPIMKKMISEIDPIRKIELAITLNELENTDEYIHHIIDLLDEKYHWTIRREAARRLARYESEDVLNSLFSALNDSEYLVRLSVAESILLIHGIDKEIASYPELHNLLCCSEPHENLDISANGETPIKRVVQVIEKIIEKKIETP